MTFWMVAYKKLMITHPKVKGTNIKLTTEKIKKKTKTNKHAYSITKRRNISQTSKRKSIQSFMFGKIGQGKIAQAPLSL